MPAGEKEHFAQDIKKKNKNTFITAGHRRWMDVPQNMHILNR